MVKAVDVSVDHLEEELLNGHVNVHYSVFDVINRFLSGHVPIEIEATGFSEGDSEVKAARENVLVLDDGIVGKAALTRHHFSVLFKLVRVLIIVIDVVNVQLVEVQLVVWGFNGDKLILIVNAMDVKNESLDIVVNIDGSDFSVSCVIHSTEG